jgi:hypothetical protein
VAKEERVAKVAAMERRRSQLAKAKAASRVARRVEKEREAREREARDIDPKALEPTKPIYLRGVSTVWTGSVFLVVGRSE